MEETDNSKVNLNLIEENKKLKYRLEAFENAIKINYLLAKNDNVSKMEQWEDLSKILNNQRPKTTQSLETMEKLNNMKKIKITTHWQLFKKNYLLASIFISAFGIFGLIGEYGEGGLWWFIGMIVLAWVIIPIASYLSFKNRKL